MQFLSIPCCLATIPSLLQPFLSLPKAHYKEEKCEYLLKNKGKSMADLRVKSLEKKSP